MGDGNHRWQMLTILFSAVVETLGTVVIKAIKIPQLYDVDYNLFESSKFGETYRNILKVTLFFFFLYFYFRDIFLCISFGWCLFFGSDSDGDCHSCQTPSYQNCPPFRMGACHNCHGYKQVSVCLASS